MKRKLIMDGGINIKDEIKNASQSNSSEIVFLIIQESEKAFKDGRIGIFKNFRKIKHS